MIVKDAGLFELVKPRLVMAGSRLIAENPKDFWRRHVPGYGEVWYSGNSAFHAVDQIADGRWIGQPFTAVEIAERRVLICPHCDKEWPEYCTCGGGRQGCGCWRCRIGALEYFEPARDREMEDARRLLVDTLGDDHKKVLTIAEGNYLEATASLRWIQQIDIRDRNNQSKLNVLVKMVNCGSFELHEIWETIMNFGLPTLVDAYGKDPKKQHQMKRMIHAAIVCNLILIEEKVPHQQFEDIHD